MMRHFIILFIAIISGMSGWGQKIPSLGQNTFSLVTFGPNASESWGDHDYSQEYFIDIPESYQGAFYIRIWDPEIGGKNDQLVGHSFDTRSTFKVNSVRPHKEGHIIKNNLAQKTFATSNTYDDEWFTFGPFFGHQGGANSVQKTNAFMISCEGSQGDDGNLYRYFISTDPNANVAVKSSSIYTYETTVRLLEKGKTAHFYPYVDEEVKRIKQYNFDLDSGVEVMIFSKDKLGIIGESSSNGDWAESGCPVTDAERNNCWDVRYVNKANTTDNDATIYFVNEYDQKVKQFNSPIGDFKFKYKWNLTKSKP